MSVYVPSAGDFRVCMRLSAFVSELVTLPPPGSPSVHSPTTSDRLICPIVMLSPAACARVAAVKSRRNAARRGRTLSERIQRERKKKGDYFTLLAKLSISHFDSKTLISPFSSTFARQGAHPEECFSAAFEAKTQLRPGLSERNQWKAVGFRGFENVVLFERIHFDDEARSLTEEESIRPEIGLESIEINRCADGASSFRTGNVISKRASRRSAVTDVVTCEEERFFCGLGEEANGVCEHREVRFRDTGSEERVSRCICQLLKNLIVERTAAFISALSDEI